MAEGKQLSVREYLHAPAIVSAFEDIMGSYQAAAYISSVVIAVGNSQALQQCSPQSVAVAAMRAATLRLSVDPALGEAHIVPFKGTATFVTGYKGLIKMAVRTGKYRYINVGKVYEGEEVITDRITGYVTIKGKQTSRKIIGYIAAFEMVNGYSKTLYMTIEEIHAHAKKYSKSYNNDNSLWKTNPEAMERKTPLRILLSQWGFFDPADAAAIQHEDDPIDVEYAPVPEDATQAERMAEQTPKTEAELMQELGF